MGSGTSRSRRTDIALRRGSRGSPILVLLAGLTRATAIGLAAAALVTAIERRSSARIALAAIAAFGIAIAVWAGFNAALTGDPLSFVRAGGNWTPDTSGLATLGRFTSGFTVDKWRSLIVIEVVLTASLVLVRFDLAL